MITLKNKLLKLFMTGMLVLTSFAFLSCGGNGAGGEDINSKSDIPSSEEVTANLKALGDYDIVVENIIDNMLDCLNDVSKQYQKYLKIK